MDAIGAQELLFPALLPREPYEASGRWTEYGDNIFRLKDRKGADYLLGPTHEEMFTLAVKDLYSLLQGPAAVDLPDPDQVPRRGPAAGRHPARPRVRHEGLLLLRRRRRRARQELPAAPRRLHPDLRPARLPLRHRRRRWPGRWAARKSEEFLATAENGEDTYVRCTNCGYAANVEAVRVPVPDAVGLRRRARRARRGHPRHPDHRHARRAPQRGASRADGPALGGRRHAQERRSWCSCTPTAPASRSPSACPATARSTRSGSGAQVEPAEVEAFDEKDFAAPPGAGQGLHRARRARRREGVRHPLPARPPGRRGHRVGHRRRRAGPARHRPRRRPRLHRRRHHRGRRGARRRRLPARAGTAWSRRAASRWATSSSSARSTPRRSTSRCSTRTASCVTVTMGSYGVGVSRAVACVAEGNHDELGPDLAARARPRPTCTSSPPARTRPSPRTAEELARELEAQGVAGAARRPPPGSARA